MFSTTVTDTGQITLPEEIREHLNLVSGSRVEFVIDEDGQVKIFPLNVPVETLSGILHRPGKEAATLDDSYPRRHGNRHLRGSQYYLQKNLTVNILLN